MGEEGREGWRGRKGDKERVVRKVNLSNEVEGRKHEAKALIGGRKEEKEMTRRWIR